MKGIAVSPNLLYLACLKTLYHYVEIRYRHVNYPFISSFDDDLEIRFFEDFGLTYRVETDETAYPELKSILNEEEPFLLLCDANVILKKRKNKNNIQIGVCSGIAVVGHGAFGRIIFSQLDKRKQFSDIPYDLLSYSRNFDVLPSSPRNISIHLRDDYVRNQECGKKLNDYETLCHSLKSNLERAISDGGGEEHQYTNRNIECFQNQKAKEKLFLFLESLDGTISDTDVDPGIVNKIFSLKLRMLRKAMVSGTASFNRSEIADSIYALWELNPHDKLQKLHLGFQKSAINFRNIIRKLYFVNDMLGEKEYFLKEIRELLADAFEYEQQLIMAFLA
ncbi:MAG: hypothetical protein LBQ15_03370 [Clostridium sp.]|nr:hypothetical protein [Clostridium sp.]